MKQYDKADLLKVQTMMQERTKHQTTENQLEDTTVLRAKHTKNAFLSGVLHRHELSPKSHACLKGIRGVFTGCHGQKDATSAPLESGQVIAL